MTKNIQKNKKTEKKNQAKTIKGKQKSTEL